MSPSAADIAAHLDQYVVGQVEAVRSLAVAAAQHYARINYRGPTRTKKANVIVVGPTGSGKTYLLRCLADYLDVPFASVSAPAITQPGFTGLDPDAPLQMLLKRGGKERAAVGIVHYDEVDKIARKDSDESEKARNLTTGLGVQQAMLDVLDAGLWTFAEGPYKGQQMDASGVLFICSGAFVGIEQIVAWRLRRGQRVAAPIPLDLGTALRQLEPSDLVSYGLIPEFVGRLPVLVTLRPLDVHELVQIMTEPVDAPLRRMAAEFEGIGARLLFDPLWPHRIAAEAQSKGTGARAIETVLRPALRDAFFHAGSGDTVYVDADGGWKIAAAPTPHSSETEAKPVETAAPSVPLRSW